MSNLIIRSTWNRANAAASKPRPGHWSWIDDSGDQVAYGPQEQQKLESSWGQGEMEIRFVILNQAYCIDLAAPGATSLRPDIPVGFQTNVRTGKKRPVFRVVGGPPASSGHDVSFSPHPPTTTSSLSSSSSSLTTSRSECRAIIPYQPSFSMITALIRGK